MKAITKSSLKDLTYHVNGACIEVHKNLGPGLLESVYQQCLEQEFKFRNIQFAAQQSVPVVYKGVKIATDLRCDFLIESALVLEIKSVDALLPIHEAQVLTYLKLLQIPKGVLVNFNVDLLFQNGQRTLVNELFRHLPA